VQLCRVSLRLRSFMAFEVAVSYMGFSFLARRGLRRVAGHSLELWMQPRNAPILLALPRRRGAGTPRALQASTLAVDSSSGSSVITTEWRRAEAEGPEVLEEPEPKESQSLTGKDAGDWKL
jgi:hypothetical protein